MLEIFLKKQYPFQINKSQYFLIPENVLMKVFGINLLPVYVKFPSKNDENLSKDLPGTEKKKKHYSILHFNEC